jgi:hypothetical protein
MKIDISKLKEVEKAFGQFEVGRIMGNGNHNYFRFGYWRPVDLGVLQAIMAPSIVVVEDDIYDDDCGWKYSYTLYEKWEWDQIQERRKEQMEKWKSEK